MQEKSMTALAIFGGFVGVLVLMAVSSIFSGYVLSVLWGWFMVPTFGLPKISVVPAIGIAIVVGYLTHQIDGKAKKDESLGQTILEGTLMAVLRPSLVLLLGYIVHLFM